MLCNLCLIILYSKPLPSSFVLCELPCPLWSWWLVNKIMCIRTCMLVLCSELKTNLVLNSSFRWKLPYNMFYKPALQAFCRTSVPQWKWCLCLRNSFQKSQKMSSRLLLPPSGGLLEWQPFWNLWECGACWLLNGVDYGASAYLATYMEIGRGGLCTVNNNNLKKHSTAFALYSVFTIEIWSCARQDILQLWDKMCLITVSSGK